MKKIAAIALASTLAFSAASGIPQELFGAENLFGFNVSAAEVVKSGTCGTNAVWTLYSDGTLGISGRGAMDDYSKSSDQPWYRAAGSISDDPFITRVVVGAGITHIGSYAFSDNTKLEAADIAQQSVLTIGRNAFDGCTALGNVTLPPRLTTIEYRAFYNCTSMTDLVIPDSVSYVGMNAFSGCKGLKNITIPVVNVNYDNNGYQQNGAFYNTYVETCTLTGNGAMSGSEYSPFQFTSIQKLIVSDNITSLYAYLASNCKSLTTVSLPEGITSIPDHCFYNSSLSSINIPQSVTSIGSNAFMYTNVQLLILPPNLTSIGSMAFDGCNKLRAISLLSKNLSIDSEAFYGCSSLKHIHIPANRTADQYTETPLPSNANYYFSVENDSNCPAGASCPLASLVQQKQVEAFVDRLYTIILDRHADAAGLQDWTIALISGKNTSADIVYGLANSPEFQNKNLSNDEVIERMYLAMLGRASDPSGKADWLYAMANGVTVNGIINGFSGSQEFANVCAGYGIRAGSITTCEPRDVNVNLTEFVSRMYTKALNRAYDVNGLNDWTGDYLAGKATADKIAYGFILSDEFVNRNLSDEAYVDTLYRTFFDREPDEGGKAGWLDELAKGTSRKDVLDGFLGAEEFANLKASFGV